MARPHRKPDPAAFIAQLARDVQQAKDDAQPGDSCLVIALLEHRGSVSYRVLTLEQEPIEAFEVIHGIEGDKLICPLFLPADTPAQTAADEGWSALEAYWQSGLSPRDFCRMVRQALDDGS